MKFNICQIIPVLGGAYDTEFKLKNTNVVMCTNSNFYTRYDISVSNILIFQLC